MDVLICDDEPLARERMARLVTHLGHQVVAQVTNGRQALEAVQQWHPDIVMLDIRMPEMDGLSCAKLLGAFEKPPAVIFCTAFDEYAVQAFQTHAIAYLLKPVGLNDVAAALSKATLLTQAQIHALSESQHISSSSYSSVNTPLQKRRHISARTHRGMELIAIDDIYYFLADQKYVVVRHKNGQVLIDDTLKELEVEFADQFIRIHRNALLSLKYLEGLEYPKAGYYQVRLQGIDERLQVSRRHLSAIKACMKHL